MKNTSYNVLKLLHNQLDDLWRIERHYQKDAKGAKCACPAILRDMRKQLQGNIARLKAELMAHNKTDKLA